MKFTVVFWSAILDFTLKYLPNHTNNSFKCFPELIIYIYYPQSGLFYQNRLAYGHFIYLWLVVRQVVTDLGILVAILDSEIFLIYIFWPHYNPKKHNLQCLSPVYTSVTNMKRLRQFRSKKYEFGRHIGFLRLNSCQFTQIFFLTDSWTFFI